MLFRSITYRYNPALSTNSLPNDLASLGIDVSKTVTSDFVVIKSAQNCTANLIDINGKTVQTATCTVGENNMDVSRQAAGLYFLNFTTDQGKTGVCKIIKN